MSDTYRYYCLDGAGHLHDAEWLKADTDEEAIAKVEAKHPDGKCEIWQGPRPWSQSWSLCVVGLSLAFDQVGLGFEVFGDLDEQLTICGVFRLVRQPPALESVLAKASNIIRHREPRPAPA